ncbi:hypothetical protein CNY89_25810, partial [Amaricoccus sp. HAR-UPW-R2A-40]
VELAMQRAEQVAAWLMRFPVGTKDGVAYGKGEPLSRSQMEGLFLSIYREQGDAAAALLPYGLERLTPEAGPVIAPTVIMLPRAGRRGGGAAALWAGAADAGGRACDRADRHHA